MSIVNFDKLFQTIHEYEQRILKLEGAERAKLLSMHQFIELGYMKAPTFYLKAPKGEIPGAIKIGVRWFVDLDVFIQSLKDWK